MTAPDIDLIRDIPGYKVILKAVLKNQIQQLVEQLSSHTNEETVILTANISDGSLGHLGSESGRSFLDDHEDMKSQFLGFCLKRHHMIKESIKKETNLSHGYSPGSKDSYRTRNFIRSDNRLRGSPYHREKGPGLKSTITHSSTSTVQCNDDVTVPNVANEIVPVDETKGDNESEIINKTDVSDSCGPLDSNTSHNEQEHPHQNDEPDLGNKDVNTGITRSSKDENNSGFPSAGEVNVKTELGYDSDIEILTDVGHSEVSDNSWDMNSASGLTFDPTGFAGTSTKFNQNQWDPNVSLSTGLTFDPSGVAGTSTNTPPVPYSYKKRFIGRQTSEQSLSNLTKDKISVFKTGQCQSDKSFRDRYLTNCDSVSAFKHDTSDDISQVYDLSIKRETNTENDDHKHNESIYQRRYKPVSRLTEAQRQRRRLMDRERQRRRRERIRAANLDFYQMYQY